MRNIRELSIGSIVCVCQPDSTELLCEVCGLGEKILKKTVKKIVKVKVLKSSIDDPDVIGTTRTYPIGRINAHEIMVHILKAIGFIESDERSWKLMYYCGDMRLYWKYDVRKRYSTFKFKPDFTQKQWVRIECRHIHKLQNIMRFLTDGEMEFKYNNNA